MLIPLTCVLLGQALITRADILARRFTTRQDSFRTTAWVTQHLPLRLTGLGLRLFAIFSMPLATAVMFMAVCAISLSALVGHADGTPFLRTEWGALALIIAAILVRGML